MRRRPLRFVFTHRFVARDRDESLGFGDYRPFRQYADTLGRRGIAVLRMDVAASLRRAEARSSRRSPR